MQAPLFTLVSTTGDLAGLLPALRVPEYVSISQILLGSFAGMIIVFRTTRDFGALAVRAALALGSPARIVGTFVMTIHFPWL